MVSFLDKLKTSSDERVGYVLEGVTVYLPAEISMRVYEEAIVSDDDKLSTACARILLAVAQNEDGSLTFEGTTLDELRKSAEYRKLNDLVNFIYDLYFEQPKQKVKNTSGG